MRRRPLTHGEALQAWRLDGELRGGHLPSQTIQFIAELQDIADEQQSALPPGFVSPECEPKWRTMLGRWFGR